MVSEISKTRNRGWKNVNYFWVKRERLYLNDWSYTRIIISVRFLN